MNESKIPLGIRLDLPYGVLGKLPSTRYECANKICAADTGYPPGDLFWWHGGRWRDIDCDVPFETDALEAGFYCQHCLEDKYFDVSYLDWTLEDVLKKICK